MGLLIYSGMVTRQGRSANFGAKRRQKKLWGLGAPWSSTLSDREVPLAVTTRFDLALAWLNVHVQSSQHLGL